jgi:flavin-binding protein dodecin
VDARIPEEPDVKDRVYKLIELSGTSIASIGDAVDKAIQLKS